MYTTELAASETIPANRKLSLRFDMLDKRNLVLSIGLLPLWPTHGSHSLIS